MTTQTITRREEIQAIWQQYQGLYVVAGVLIGVLIFPFLELLITNLSELLIGLVPEVIGIGFTVFVLDRIYENRRKREQFEHEQQRAIADLRSATSDSPQWIISYMDKRDLFKQSDLAYINLEKTNLPDVNLEGANLHMAHMERANLTCANLAGAYLGNAHLEGAILRAVNLEGANLGATNLKGADLYNANLENVKWSGLFVFPATLPDGKKWNVDEKERLGRFTNPQHPEFYTTRQEINAIREEMGLDPIK